MFPINLTQAGIYFGAGVGAGLAAYSDNKWLGEKVPKLFNYSGFGYEFPSAFSSLVAYGAADFTQNLFNYYGTKGKWPGKLTDLYEDGFKSLWKFDFYMGSSFWGYQLTNAAFDSRFR